VRGVASSLKSQKKKSINGKQKGNGFEREVCKKLSNWLSEGKRDDFFWRTQLSGGRYTIRDKKGLITEGQDGDISSTTEEGKFFTNLFSIECKNYKDLDIWSLITLTEGQNLYGFWKKLIKQSESCSKNPLLIAKQNFKPVLFICSIFLSFRLKNWFNISPILIVPNNNPNEIMNIFLFDTILNLDPKTFKEGVIDEGDRG